MKDKDMILKTVSVAYNNTPTGQEAKNLQVLLVFMSFIKKKYIRGITLAINQLNKGYN